MSKLIFSFCVFLVCAVRSQILSSNLRPTERYRLSARNYNTVADLHPSFVTNKDTLISLTSNIPRKVAIENETGKCHNMLCYESITLF